MQSELGESSLQRQLVGLGWRQYITQILLRVVQFDHFFVRQHRGYIGPELKLEEKPRYLMSDNLNILYSRGLTEALKSRYVMLLLFNLRCNLLRYGHRIIRKKWGG